MRPERFLSRGTETSALSEIKDAAAPGTGQRRRRRTAEEAREVILDSAEKRLIEVGPDGLKLQEIARDVGVSHPAILHHFGSRDGLVEAVVGRSLANLTEELVGLVAGPQGQPRSIVDLFDRVFSLLGERSISRQFIWLLLGGRTIDNGVHAVRTVAAEVHERLIEGGGDVDPSRGITFEDTLFTVLAVGSAALGMGIAGVELRRSAELLDDDDFDRRFRRWLARVVVGFIAGPEAFSRPPSNA